MRNLGLKLISIFIAVALHLFVTDQSNSSDLTLTVPIQLNNLPEDKVVILPLNKQVLITLVGPSFVISKINPRELHFEIDLPEKLGEIFNVNLDKTMINLPRYVDLVGIEPKQQEFVFDSLVEEEFPIHVPDTGKLDSNYELEFIHPVQETIKIKCPAKEIKRIRRVETAPIDLSSISSSGIRQLDLILPSYCISNNQSIDIEVKINKAQIEKKISLPIKVRGDRYNIDPKKVDLEISGEIDVLSKIDFSKIQAYVRPKSNESEAKVEFELPVGVSFVTANPEKVKVARKVK